jgi:HK97 family phage portal protein
MGLFSAFKDTFGVVEFKANELIIPQSTVAEIHDDISSAMDGPTSVTVSAVVACARVIAEGLALPPCSVDQLNATGGKTAAMDHPLYDLLTPSGTGPNKLQTAFEFKEMNGLHAALTGDAFSFINRSRRKPFEILELIPIDPATVTIVASSTLGEPVSYLIGGTRFAPDVIFHFKGPSYYSHTGINPLTQARTAIGLACAAETFGANLFKNGARPGGIVGVNGTVSPEQLEAIRTAWNGRGRGLANAHSTAFLPADVSYTPLASTANDAQWIETRRFQIEDVCRYFRVSPTKVFQALGSQSYASVEQAHIAHDQDTDALWHERFVQAANKQLLTKAERASGLRITLDNRAALRGTAVERMTYYQLGISNGVFTRNEVREMEGFDRIDDASADTLTPAANLFGPSSTPSVTPDTPSD